MAKGAAFGLSPKSKKARAQKLVEERREKSKKKQEQANEELLQGMGLAENQQRCRKPAM